MTISKRKKGGILMLDYLVLYQSESGNTKKIAASIFSRLPGNSKDLIDIDTDKTIPEANVYFIGFCSAPRKLQYGGQ